MTSEKRRKNQKRKEKAALAVAQLWKTKYSIFRHEKSVLRLVSIWEVSPANTAFACGHHYDIIFSRQRTPDVCFETQFSLFLVSYCLRYSWLSVDETTTEKMKVRENPISCVMLPSTDHESTLSAARIYCQFSIF